MSPEVEEASPREEPTLGSLFGSCRSYQREFFSSLIALRFRHTTGLDMVSIPLLKLSGLDREGLLKRKDTDRKNKRGHDP